ncbi:MAG: orotate phosphoribosyltransferase, partial [Campylobacterales bacterium]
MDVKEIYRSKEALLEGHFLLSSGKHSNHYLQSAKVLEDPKVAKNLLENLASMIKKSGLKIDTIASPALGGVLAGYELASALGVRFVFTERVDGVMTLRRGFEVFRGEKVFICEDIITTGGSALEAKEVVEKLGAKVVGFGAIANRGLCHREGSEIKASALCKLPDSLPFFALEVFIFDTYLPDECPMCKEG